MTLNLPLSGGNKHIHCVGIGGAGMFPIVQILHSVGYHITGSDNNEGDIVNLEREMGIDVKIGHDAKNVEGADMLMYTAALLNNNVELARAQELGIPCYERAEVLGAISGEYSNAIGICGTHGKTTITSMLVQILHGAGKEPSAVIGGKLKAINGYGIFAKSDTFVYEACEFKDHFLSTHPDISVVINIDNDHMEYFGTMDNVFKSYVQFCNMSKLTFYNGDDANTCTAMNNITTEKISFGFTSANDFYIENLRRGDGFTRYYDLMHNGKKLTEITLNVPGMHNVINSVAAVAVAYTQGVSLEDITKNLSEFYGAGRRFEKVGDCSSGAIIVDDYAHHHTEIIATLKTAKEQNFSRVWAVFQPFTYSRTEKFLAEFAQALTIADRVVLTPIMGGREENTTGISSQDLAEKIDGCVCLDSFAEVAQYIKDNTASGDLVITMGCGDVYKCARMML